MITLIVGTNRPGSNSRKIRHAPQEILRRILKVPLNVLDLAKLPPEIFSPTSYAEKPKTSAVRRRNFEIRRTARRHAGIQRQRARRAEIFH